MDLINVLDLEVNENRRRICHEPESEKLYNLREKEDLIRIAYEEIIKEIKENYSKIPKNTKARLINISNQDEKFYYAKFIKRYSKNGFNEDNFCLYNKFPISKN